MKLATTIQFRSAVRACAAVKNRELGNSWTNATGTAKRVVGVEVKHFMDTQPLAHDVEAFLNTQGLTAATRATRSGTWNCYIRGTCVYEA